MLQIGNEHTYIQKSKKAEKEREQKLTKRIPFQVKQTSNQIICAFQIVIKTQHFFMCVPVSCELVYDQYDVVYAVHVSRVSFG